jgi:hypothetical protein
MKTAQIGLSDLKTPYVPVAIYLEDADSVEYVRHDVACVYRRIDGFLTLALDLKTHKLNGFRLKGFKNFFIKHLKPKYKLLDDDFIPLVSVIEDAVQLVGDKVTGDPEKRKAYRDAKRMAHDDRVSIEPLSIAA